MTFTKTHVLTLATVGIVTAGVLGTSQISAQEQSDTVFITSNPMSSLVAKLATKFGVSEEEVQQVFDEEHKEREAQMEVKNEERLSRLVTDGKITEDQKTLILAKQKELKERGKSDFESIKSMTAEQRRSFMEEKRAELESWADENNIDPQYLMTMHKMKGRGGPGMDGPPVFIHKTIGSDQ